MALATIQHSNPRLDLWGYHTFGTETQTIDKPMTSIMTYQNHLASSDFSGLEGPHPTYAMGFDQTRPGAHHQPPPPAQQQSSRLNNGSNSRASLSGIRDPGSTARRSFSTPMNGVRQEATPEQTSHPGTPNEKKRTKLGYHRTSIACSHCRRRKIRCVTSPDTPNKCSNCIRLKKICSFCPVDQQGVVEGRTKGQSRSSTGQQIMHASSPESHGEAGTAGSTPFSDGVVTPGLPAKDEGLSPMAKEEPSMDPLANQPYGAGHPTMTDWMPGMVSSNGMIGRGNSSASWRQYPSGTEGGAPFHPYGQAPGGTPLWTHGSTDTVGRGDVNWVTYPTPVRSMAYSEGAMNNQQHMPYLPHAHNGTEQRGTANYPGMYHHMGSGAETTATSVLSATNGLPVGTMGQSGHGSWRHGQAAGMNTNGHHATVGAAYNDWGYSNGGTEHVGHAQDA